MGKIVARENAGCAFGRPPTPPVAPVLMGRFETCPYAVSSRFAKSTGGADRRLVGVEKRRGHFVRRIKSGAGSGHFPHERRKPDRSAIPFTLTLSPYDRGRGASTAPPGPPPLTSPFLNLFKK